MIDQFEKYKNNPNVKIITCGFHGDNRGYSYLCDFDVDVGDTVVARMRDGEMKCLTVQTVKGSSHIMPNPPFKKYAWVCGIVKQFAVNHYASKDDDIGVTSKQEDVGAVEFIKPEVNAAPSVNDRMKDIFGE